MAAAATRHTKPFRYAGLGLTLILLAGCTTQPQRDLITGSISKPGVASSMTLPELTRATDSAGKVYERNPRDKQAGLTYASLLRSTGRNAQALAVMQQVTINHPNDREVLSAYGKAQAAAGQLEQALTTIVRAQTPDRPDWRLKSAEGAVLDQLGRPNEARQRYREALDLQPNEPSVLSNIGMSYLLAKDLKTAETHLQQAVQQPGADSSVRQNLALAVGLQGRFSEAEAIATRELSPDQAQANLTYLRGMLAQQNAWKQLAANP